MSLPSGRQTADCLSSLGIFRELELTRHRVATSNIDSAESRDGCHQSVAGTGASRIGSAARGLASSSARPPEPIRGEEWAMVWRDPATDELRTRSASPVELLALKILSEDLDLDTAAIQRTSSTPAALNNLLLSASRSGIILAPATRIVRTEGSGSRCGRLAAIPPWKRIFFTLQWHLTNRCDLNCKHCYRPKQPRNTHNETIVKLAR